MSGISSKALAHGDPLNNEKTFQGQQIDNDLGLNWIQFKWRNHDPQIGRFIEIDPLGNDYVHNSVYAFSENKVTNHIELEGLESTIPPPPEFNEIKVLEQLQKLRDGFTQAYAQKMQSERKPLITIDATVWQGDLPSFTIKGSAGIVKLEYGTFNNERDILGFRDSKGISDGIDPMTHEEVSRTGQKFSIGIKGLEFSGTDYTETRKSIGGGVINSEERTEQIGFGVKAKKTTVSYSAGKVSKVKTGEVKDDQTVELFGFKAGMGVGVDLSIKLNWQAPGPVFPIRDVRGDMAGFLPKQIMIPVQK